MRENVLLAAVFISTSVFLAGYILGRLQERREKDKVTARLLRRVRLDAVRNFVKGVDAHAGRQMARHRRLMVGDAHHAAMRSELAALEMVWGETGGEDG